MKTSAQTTTRRQRTGGLAALYLAFAYLLAMPFFLMVVKYPRLTDPAEKVALLVSKHWSMHAMYLITYVFFGIVLGVLALALYRRLRSAAPVVMQVATAVGLLWAFVLVASGLVFNAGMASVVAAYPTDPSQAISMWQAIEPVAQGLGGSGGEILGGLWVLLVSLAGLRTAGFAKPLAWFGLAVGAVGIASVIPPAKDAAILFGVLQIGWFVWLGITMLRAAERPESRPVAEVEPLQVQV